MDKGPERFPSQDKYGSKANFDLGEVMENNKDGEFRGTDFADVTKSYKANLPKQPVVNFDHFESTAKYRVEIKKEELKEGEKE